MNTSLLRMRKAIAAFTIGTLLASFLAVPAAFAAGIPEWAMEGANAYLKAETREMGNVAANKCEVAKMIVTALDLQVGENEMQAGAAFQDLQGGMSWCQGAAGAVAVNEIATGNNGVFGAEGSVSRAVVATMLKRAYSLDTFEPATLSAERQAEFAGMEWAQNDMAIAVAAGLIKGDDQGRLNPAGQASKWAVATMLYRAANMGAESTTPEATPEEATVTPEVAPTGGALTVSVSSSTPSSAKLPKGAEGIAVASYDFTAGSDAVTVTGLVLTRGGLSNDGTLTGVTLVDSNGVRLSKTKTFSTDTDDARVNFMNGGLTIPARSTVEVTVVAGLGTTAGEEFNLQVLGADDVTSNSSSVSGSFPLVSEDMEVAPVTAGELLIEKDTAPSAPDLGDKQAVVSRFELIANTADRDVIFHGITFEEIGTIDADEIQNFTLEIEGEVVATTATLVNDYLAFNLDTPMVLEESETYDAEILADIVSGPGKTISFKLDSDLDVRAEDADYGYGVAVNAAGGDGFNGNANANLVSLTVQAGELTVVATDASELEILDDQDNIVLGSFEIFPVHGQDIELKQFETQISLTAGTANLDVNDILENVELRSNFGTFSLDGIGADGGVNADSDSVTLVDDSVDVLLPSDGTFKADIVADIKDVANNDHFAAAKLEVRISSIGKSTQTGAGLYFEEQEEDTAITDVTPSSIVFSEIEGKKASLTSSALTLSSSLNSVHGTEGVVMHKVDVAAGNASAAYVNKMVFNKVSLDDNIGRGDNVLMTLTAKQDAVSNASLSVTDGVSTDTCTLAGADINGAEAAALVAVINETCSLFSATLHTAGGNGVGKFYVSYLGNLLDANNEIEDAKDGGSFDLAQAAFAADTDIDNTRVNVAKLYVDSVEEGNLVQEVNASDFSTSEITFDDFNGSQSVDGRIEIASDDSREFFLVFDLISDEDNANDAMQVKLTSIEAEDARGDDLNETQDRNSTRTVTVRGAGTLTVNADDTDPLIDRSTYVLAGQSLVTNSFEFVVQNETLRLEDITITVAENGDNTEELFSKVEILDSAMNVLDSEQVTSNVITFSDSNIELAEGTHNLYVKLYAHEMGKDKSGVQSASYDETVSFAVTTVKGVKELASSANHSATSTLTTGTVPVQVTNLAFLSSAEGISVESKLTSGSNNVAIFSVETAAHTTTESSDGSIADTKVNNVLFDLDKLSASNDTLIAGATIERIGRNDAPVELYNYGQGSNDLELTFGDGAVSLVINGQLLESADGNGGANNDASDIEGKIHAVTGVAAARNADKVTITAQANLIITDITGNVTISNQGAFKGVDKLYAPFSAFAGEAELISAGQTANYLVKVDVTTDDNADNDDYIEIDLDSLSASVSYSNSDTASNNTAITNPRLSRNFVDGIKISE